MMRWMRLNGCFMKNKRNAWDMLLEIAGDKKISFDPYRDITKGCGEHCRAWEDDANKDFCSHHKEAILKGDFLVKGGKVEELIEYLKGKKDGEK